MVTPFVLGISPLRYVNCPSLDSPNCIREVMLLLQYAPFSTNLLRVGVISIPFILLGGLIATETIHWSSLNYKYVHPFKNSPTESIFKFGIIYGTIIQCASNNKQDCNPEEVAKLEPFFYESKYSIEYPPKENIILIIVVCSFFY